MSRIYSTSIEDNIHRPWQRNDYSPYLCHLTRGKNYSRQVFNLLKILLDEKIEARNFHCYLGPAINDSEMDDDLRDQFNTVSFTEIPIPYIRKITGKIKGREKHLSKFGIVFKKKYLLARRSRYNIDPVIYINTNDGLQALNWKSEFSQYFRDVSSLEDLTQNLENMKSKVNPKWIIRRFALTSKIDIKHDFQWEREWRHHLDFNFKYKYIAGITVANQDRFERKIAELIPKIQKQYSLKYRNIKNLNDFLATTEIFDISNTKQNDLSKHIKSIQKDAYVNSTTDRLYLIG